MSFKQLLEQAKKRNPTAQEKILRMYHPLIRKTAKVDGVADDDLYQDLCILILHCIDVFRLDYPPNPHDDNDLQGAH